jgi:hypothetical protein
MSLCIFCSYLTSALIKTAPATGLAVSSKLLLRLLQEFEYLGTHLLIVKLVNFMLLYSLQEFLSPPESSSLCIDGSLHSSKL